MVEAALRPGDVAIDATAGNGHDTVALARAVGPEGLVYAFDVQAAALQQTDDRLRDHNLRPRVDLIRTGHEQMQKEVGEWNWREIGAVMFNLGYLPGHGSDLTTTPDTTIPALNAALSLLRPGGVITVVAYTGHEGGTAEAQAVDDWAAHRSQQTTRALSYRFVNQDNDPPRLVAIEKRADRGAG
jgi:predicted methyltransferase